MDVVVVDIDPYFSLLLSKQWAVKLGGSIQLDWSYATISLGKNQ